MKTALTTWTLLLSLLLQPLAWALPAAQSPQAERLVHQVAHALDHGHHLHGLGPGHADGPDPALGWAHDLDTTLLLDSDLPSNQKTSHNHNHNHKHKHNGNGNGNGNGTEATPAAAQPAMGADAPGPHGAHGQHHSHAGEYLQLLGMPVSAAQAMPGPAHSAPSARRSQQPPSADLAPALRPPQRA